METIRKRHDATIIRGWVAGLAGIRITGTAGIPRAVSVC
jgi:hypothetical protein